jgi:transcriptional regulator GlxA family with amidase domain
MGAPQREKQVRRLSVPEGTELVVRATGGALSITIEGDGEFELVRSPVSGPRDEAMARPRDLRVERALAAMRAEPTRRFSMLELARLAGASRSNFVRLFTRAVGATPSAWLTTHRLELARQLLAETNQGLAEIASRSGYASEFGLSRAFKRRFGVAPSVFRRATRSASNALRCAA